MENVRVVDVPLTGTVDAPKDLEIVGGDATTKLAVLLVVPVPPLVELIAPVVLLTVPDCVPMTFTVTVQVLEAEIAPPDRLIVVVLAAAVTDPPQVSDTPGAEATCSPLRRESLNATPVSDTVLPVGLVSVKVRVVVPFKGRLAAPKTLLIVGGATTVRLALAVRPVPPSFDVTAVVVLFLAPAAVPVTFTEKVQNELAATLAPVRLTTLPPAVAEIVPPPQLPLSPLLGEATASPEGSVSLKPTPVKVMVVLLL